VQHREGLAALQRGRDGGRLRPLLAQLGGQLVLPGVAQQVGHPQLVDDEQQQHIADREQQLSGAAGGGAQGVRPGPRHGVRC
jgi:hypothetical protein